HRSDEAPRERRRHEAEDRAGKALHARAEAHARIGILVGGEMIRLVDEAAPRRRAAREAIDPADEVVRARLPCLERADCLLEARDRDGLDAEPSRFDAPTAEREAREAAEEPEAADRGAKELVARLEAPRVAVGKDQLDLGEVLADRADLPVVLPVHVR